MSDPTDSSWWFGGADAQNSEYQDRAKMLRLINQGFQKNGITSYQAPQMQYAQGNAAQLQGGDDAFRNGQLQQMYQLQGIASGQQQGAGELAAQRQMMGAQAAQQGMARMARGGNAALAYRNAANNAAALGVSGAGMGQQAALQDQQAAQGMLGGLTASGRAGDFNTQNANAGYQQQANMTNAQLRQGASQANAGFAQGNQQLNSQNYLGLMNQLNSMDANQLNAVNAANQNKGMAGGMLSAGGQVAGAAIMHSDERLKKDVADGRDEIDKMLDGLAAKSYEYKDPKHGEGRRVGIMAQDLERSTAGKRIVFDAPDGKALDVNKALSAALAASARLNERVRNLEGKGK